MSQAVDVFVHDNTEEEENRERLREMAVAAGNSSFKTAGKCRWKLAARAGKAYRTAKAQRAETSAGSEAYVPKAGQGPYNPFSADGRSNAFLNVLKELDDVGSKTISAKLAKALSPAKAASVGMSTFQASEVQQPLDACSQGAAGAAGRGGGGASDEQLKALEARLDAKINSRADALAAQLTTLTNMSEQRLEALLLVVTATGPKAAKVAGAISGPDGMPRQKQRKQRNVQGISMPTVAVGAVPTRDAPLAAGAVAAAPVDGAVIDAMAC